jgi:O-antigen/teichoic acid export membrane protein
LRNFYSDSLFYGGLGVLNQLTSLFLFPILVRYLSKDEYAIIDSFTVLSGFISVVLFLGLDSGIARLFADANDDSERKQIFSQVTFCMLFFLITVLPIIYSYRNIILFNYIGDISHGDLFGILLINLFFYLFIQNFLGLFKWTFDKLNYFVLSFGHAILTIIISIYYIKFLDLGLESVFYGQLSSSSIFIVVGLLQAKKYLTTRISLNYIRSAYCVGIPICLISVLGNVIFIIERKTIVQYLSLSDIAVYSVSLKIVLILVLFTNTFNTAWTPYAFSIYKKVNSNIIFNRIFISINSLLFFVIFFLCYFSHTLIEFLAGADYYDSSSLVAPLLLSRFYAFSSRFISIGVYIKKKNMYLIIPQVFYIYTFLVVAPVLIQKELIMGFCKAILLCSLISFFIHLFLSYKISDIRFHFLYYIPIMSFTVYLFC